MRKIPPLLTCCLLLIASALPAADIRPIGEKGKHVDWWFIYKVPHLTGKNGDSATGLEYLYFDAGSTKPVLSKNRLLDGNGALDLTLDKALNHPDASVGYILYNDEIPDTTAEKEGLANSEKYGHTKGVIAFDVESKTAFWLVHSWPKFPDIRARAAKPSVEYGQTFLCLAISLETAEKIAQEMLLFQYPQVYDPKIPKAVADKGDSLYLLSQPLVDRGKEKVTGEQYLRIDDQRLKTLGGMPFRVIAKHRTWGKDFWNQLVGPELGENLDVESWIRGKIPPIEDSDGIHKTFDIKFVTLAPFANYTWPEQSDHAKWAVTEDNPKDRSKNHKWVCVGDINRMVSQRKRGGGTVAFQNDDLWQVLKDSEKLVIPPGLDKDKAKEHVKKTHKAEN